MSHSQAIATYMRSLAEKVSQGSFYSHRLSHWSLLQGIAQTRNDGERSPIEDTLLLALVQRLE